jgi:small subunit ribosomal protein S13
MTLYISETEIAEDKSIALALTNIYGLSNTTAKRICKKLGFLSNLKTKYLTPGQLDAVIEEVKGLNLKLAGDLRKSQTLNIQRLISIKSYRGLRILQGLPVRGQRTHSNAKSAKKHKKGVQVETKSKSAK